MVGHLTGSGSVLDHRTMLMMATVGFKPYETTDEPNKDTDDTCTLCPAQADGFDAERGVPVCLDCAEGNA